MHRKLLMPKLGLTMTEGQIAEWLVPVGAPFKREDTLFVVETDKVATEIPAEANGVLTEITVPVGRTVAVGGVVGYWEDTAAAGNTSPSSGAENAQPAPVVALAVAARPAEPASLGTSTRVPVTPLARRLAQQLGVDLGKVKGSGPGKRIKAADVQAAAAQAAPAGTPARIDNAVAQPIRSTPTPVQATMARRLTAVKRDVPHFYLAVEARVSDLVKLRRDLNAVEGSVRLTLNHFVVAAVGRALNDLPDANRVWSDDQILTFTETDVGIAVNTERGLFVPVVRNAGRVSLTAVARRAQAQVERARDGKLTVDDMAGGAITVSNAGMHNVKFMTPIINPGQAMILGVGSITRNFRPDAEERPTLCDEMGLVLACDHRILDGVAGLKFLNRVVVYLEQPMKLLLDA
jgi:pyruvate dehydrogenase E2 component (dihydrolipoamide acetyltransferase)